MKRRPVITRALAESLTFGLGHLVTIREDMPATPQDARNASYSPRMVRDMDRAITYLRETIAYANRKESKR